MAALFFARLDGGIVEIKHNLFKNSNEIYIWKVALVNGQTLHQQYFFETLYYYLDPPVIY